MATKPHMPLRLSLRFEIRERFNSLIYAYASRGQMQAQEVLNGRAVTGSNSSGPLTIDVFSGVSQV